MNIELRQLAERLSKFSECTTYQIISLEIVHAVAKVAKAYLDEHHADDDEKLSLDDAEKEFGERGHIDATISTHHSVVAVKIDDWIMLDTRGDLRTLLSILPAF